MVQICKLKPVASKQPSSGPFPIGPGLLIFILSFSFVDGFNFMQELNNPAKLALKLANFEMQPIGCLLLNLRTTYSKVDVRTHGQNACKANNHGYIFET